MKAVGLFEAKAKLSELCERVARDDTPILITRRGKPLVRIEPARPAHRPKSVWIARSDFLRKQGGMDEQFEPPARPVGPVKKLGN